MNDVSGILSIYPIVLILSIIRTAMFNLNFINRKEVNEKSHIRILEDFSIIELGILCVANAWITEDFYSDVLNFPITKIALRILILLTIGVVIKTIIKNFSLLVKEDKKKVWVLLHGMSIMLILIFSSGIGGFLLLLFMGLGYLYIHLMLVVNIFFIIEFIIIFLSVFIKKFRKKN